MNFGGNMNWNSDYDYNNYPYGEYVEEKAQSNVGLIIFGVCILSIGLGMMFYFMFFRKPKGNSALLNGQSMQMTSEVSQM